ncbi:MAG: hypothetical protein QMD36_04390, partial [Candidatus Aenigmarchaeota archaeon]|nr:hypothetical protein [Candidatus Aenigmarchaeota archaeon]
ADLGLNSIPHFAKCMKGSFWSPAVYFDSVGRDKMRNYVRKQVIPLVFDWIFIFWRKYYPREQIP